MTTPQRKYFGQWLAWRRLSDPLSAIRKARVLYIAIFAISITVGSIAVALFPDPGKSLLAMCVGIGLGAIISLEVRLAAMQRVWCVLAEVVDWKKLNRMIDSTDLTGPGTEASRFPRRQI